MSKHSLMYGYNAGRPEGNEVAWGCRAIVNFNHGRTFLDIPWDRTDAIGPDEKREEFLATLRNEVGDDWINIAQELLDRGDIRGDEEKEVVLHADENAIIKANTNGSYGYLYVVAYPASDEKEKAA